jgi:hypothetical protein
VNYLVAEAVLQYFEREEIARDGGLYAVDSTQSLRSGLLHTLPPLPRQPGDVLDQLTAPPHFKAKRAGINY